MSSEFASTVNTNLSGLFSRPPLGSDALLYAGLRTSVMLEVGSNPLIGLSLLQDEMLIAPSPSIMYGPDEMRSRPYFSATPEKHLPTSGGIGPAAGIPMRKRKSPVGCVRSNEIVESFGVWMPVIVFAVPLPKASKPLITL